MSTNDYNIRETYNIKDKNITLGENWWFQKNIKRLNTNFVLGTLTYVPKGGYGYRNNTNIRLRILIRLYKFSNAEMDTKNDSNIDT